jgi:hypothetical protein
MLRSDQMAAFYAAAKTGIAIERQPILAITA